MKAKDIRIGHEIEVNLGKGKVYRTVDKAVTDGKTGLIVLTLYTESGVRPKIIISPDVEVNVRQ